MAMVGWFGVFQSTIRDSGPWTALGFVAELIGEPGVIHAGAWARPRAGLADLTTHH